MSRFEVLVIGAGPVGLALATRLAGAGIEVAVLEAREAPPRGSRAIGLHPPGLAALEELGVADRLLAQGVRVRGGQAFAGRDGTRLRRLGRVSFGSLPEPYPFVLTVPQAVTEAALREAASAAGVRVAYGQPVVGLEADPSGVKVATQGNGGDTIWEALRVVACDGAAGTTHARIGVARHGRSHGGAYLMADLTDDTRLGADAAIYLAHGGVVESFPLPERRRRWVVRTGADAPPEAAHVAELVAARTGQRVDAAGAAMVSAFRPRWARAERFVADRVWLCGDAAHEVSPIGGQGLNLGLLGARRAARQLIAILRHGAEAAEAGAAYQAQQRRAARAVTRRSKLFTQLGRGGGAAPLAAAAARLLLSRPVAPYAARLFTMQA